MSRKVIFFILFLCQPLFAGNLGSENFIGLNFVSNLEKEPYGISAYFMKSEFLGYYADYKRDFKDPGEDILYHNISLWEAEKVFDSEFLGKKESYYSCNSGLILLLSENWAIYGGIGYTKRTVYRQYYHPDEIFGKKGKYWIEDPYETEDELNYLFGTLIGVENLIFQIGMDTNPKSLVLGGGLGF